ncbi:MAG: TonB-dependent receptor domain-containing protein, partial [Longimicrobiales bacterium]
NSDQLNTRLRYLAQTVLSGPLRGEHSFDALNDSRLEWRAGLSQATRYEPNTREVLYRAFDGTYYWDNFIQSGSSFYQDMTENGVNGAVDFELPFEMRSLPAKLSIGGSADTRTRGAYTRRFRFLPENGSISDETRALAPNALFAESNIGPGGFEIREATFNTDNYDAEQSVYAGYAMLDFELLPRLRVLAGARYETTSQEVAPFDLFDEARTPIDPAMLDADDILPALNLTYAVQDGMNVRVGASRTLARPQFRELAPFSFADYAGGYLTIGNPTLGLTRITNLDARWEWFFQPGALLAVSGFYKQFDDPIETLVLPSTELIKTWVNAPRATNYGVELEARTSLGAVADALANVAVNANLTLVTSDVNTGAGVIVYLPGEGATPLAVVDKDRPLQGQSPYVVNLGATYLNTDIGLSASVLFNRFGRRIDLVGSQELEDIYEEARNQLDVTVEQHLTSGVALKLSAARLLGSQVEFTQFGDLIRGYDLGRNLSLSVSWELGR